MRLVYPEYDISINIVENRTNILVIENPKVMSELLRELFCQAEGEEGKFVVSDNNGELNFAKAVHIVPNVFQLNCNERKIITRLYQLMEEMTTENFIQEGIQTNGEVSKFVNQMCSQVPYHLEFQNQFTPADYLKLAKVEFVHECDSLLEDIIQYIDIISQLFSPELIIFFHLKLFLPVNEIKQLYEYAFYHKIPIMIIEGNMSEKLPEEDIIIIDRDCCTIKI